MQEKFSRRRLPHWDLPGAVYFLTTCLHGSIPAQGLVEISRLRDSLARQRPPPGADPREWAAVRHKKLFARIDRWLDQEPAVRHLENVAVAQVVEDSLQHFDGVRYDLIAWVIMPSHVHWVFRPRDEWVGSLGGAADERSPRQRIQRTLNSRTARECNQLLGLSGRFWQWESYDHCVRDEAELERIIAYVHANPVKAGLAARPELYRFSSCRVHMEREGGVWGNW